MINHSINSLQEMQRLKCANCRRDVISIICTEVTGQTQPLPQAQRPNEAPQEAMWGAGGGDLQAEAWRFQSNIYKLVYTFILFSTGER